MNTRQAIALNLALAALALVYALALYPFLPDRIPIHWNIRGEADGWAAKEWAIFFGPGMMLLFAGMTLALPKMSQRDFDIASFRPTFNYVLFVCSALFAYIHIIMLQAALYPALDWGKTLIGGMFLVFALLGNVTGKLRRNAWVGVRTPWTLASDTVWNATHRLAGRLMVAGGVLGALALWMGAPVALCFALLMAALLYPVAYSYLLYRRL